MSTNFAIENFRKQFTILDKPLKNGRKLVFFDNLATTQKPQCVIDKIVDFYSNYNANVHRGLYEFSEKATAEYEQTRSKLAGYLGTGNAAEIVFVRGATEAINLVAHSYGKKFLKKGDEILIGAAEHHSNYLPWQALEQEIGVVRKIIPLDSNCDIDMRQYGSMFSRRTKFVAIQHISSVLGSVNDIKTLSKIAHEHGAKILIDGACSLALGKLNLKEVDCDFFACSGHKCFGPTGSGFLFGKYHLLEEMSPYNTGGNAVNSVQFGETEFKLPPDKFEAGTPDIAAVIGFGAAIDFLETIDWKVAGAHLFDLTQRLDAKLKEISGIKIYGNPRRREGIFSFNLNGIHCHDVAAYLGSKGIAVRAGTHCVQPLMQFLGIPGTVRISMAIYSTPEEIDMAAGTMAECQTIFR
ncbi:MAG: cysteine desulfurase [Puniceicoccales bacterium]|jgi:cysteine desulfurase/selenocysteine lyase|nr:cysteine desulfurase [Puniceicoccales bacterium]